MVLILYDDERVALRVLVGDIPGRSGRACPAADSKPGALTQGVEGEAAVLAQDLAAVVLDRPRLRAQIAAQELLKGPLADETDAGAVGLVIHRQSRRMREPADLGLAQLTDRK